MNKSNQFIHHFFKLITSILLSYLFVYLIPWHDIKYFHDFEVYKYRAAQLFTLGNNQEESFGVFILFSEILWTKILQILPIYFYDINSGITFISFSCLSVYIYYTISRVNPFLGYILLFNPIFIDLIISQVRIGVSFALLLIAYSFRRTIIFPIILISVATLIHTATILLVAIFLSLIFLKRIVNDNKKFLQISLVFPLFIMLFIQTILLPIFDFFGDSERAGYFINPIYSSVFFALPWIFFSAMIALLPKSNLVNENIDYVAFAVSMGSLFFFSSIFQFYGSRFVAVSFPLFIISINCLNKQFRLPIFLLLFLYQLTYFSYWL